jgi:hypothetical protein
MQAKGTSITPSILNKIEHGEEISSHRLEALEACIKQKFPEFDGKELCEKPKTGVFRKILSLKAEILLGAVFLALFILYISFENLRTEFANFAAGPLVIAGAIFAIYKIYKRKP